jgi:ABC-type transporter Mla MlaB component
MLRISQIESEPGPTVLRLEGKLVGKWVEELEALSASILAVQPTIALDLTDLDYADGRGLALLRRLRETGIAIRKSSPFLAEELKL